MLTPKISEACAVKLRFSHGSGVRYDFPQGAKLEDITATLVCEVISTAGEEGRAFFEKVVAAAGIHEDEPFAGKFAGKDIREMTRKELIEAIQALGERHV